MKIELNKQQYSEYVVRNALYWMTARCSWTLKDIGEQWVVDLKNESEDVECEFYRLLNDYKLRGTISLKTNALRYAIVEKVLTGIDERLNS